jgi:hypothetical protein
MRYFKFRWNWVPGNDEVEWGADSWWFYEFGPDNFIHRQVMLYDSGVHVRYGPDHRVDEYGELLSDVRLDEVDLTQGQEIGASEFESVWQSGPWTNEPAESKRT